MSSVNDNARKIFSLRYLRESFFLDILLHLNKDFALLFIFYLMTYFTCKYFLKCPQVFCIQPAFFSLRLILWKASFPAPNHLRTSIYRGLSIYYYCFLQLLLCATKRRILHQGIITSLLEYSGRNHWWQRNNSVTFWMYVVVPINNLNSFL